MGIPQQNARQEAGRVRTAPTTSTIGPRAPRWTSSRTPSRAPSATEPLPHQRPDGWKGFLQKLGRAPGKTCMPRVWVLPQVPRSEALRPKSPSALSGPMGKRTTNQDWAASPGAGFHPHDDMKRAAQEGSQEGPRL